MKDKVAPHTNDTWISLATIALWIGILIVLLSSYGSLPETIPTHFDANVNADSTGNKSTLLVLSGVGLIVTLVMAIIPRYPQFYNIPFAIDSNKRQAAIEVLNTMTKKVNLCMAILFTLLIGGTIRIATGKWEALPPLGLGVIMLLMLGVLVTDTMKLWKYRER